MEKKTTFFYSRKRSWGSWTSSFVLNVAQLSENGKIVQFAFLLQFLSSSLSSWIPPILSHSDVSSGDFGPFSSHSHRPTLFAPLSSLIKMREDNIVEDDFTQQQKKCVIKKMKKLPSRVQLMEWNWGVLACQPALTRVKWETEMRATAQIFFFIFTHLFSCAFSGLRHCQPFQWVKSGNEVVVCFSSFRIVCQLIFNNYQSPLQ